MFTLYLHEYYDSLLKKLKMGVILDLSVAYNISSLVFVIFPSN